MRSPQCKRAARQRPLLRDGKAAGRDESARLWHVKETPRQSGDASCYNAGWRRDGVPGHGQLLLRKKEKRQTSRRIEDVPHSYLASIVANELRTVKRFLRPMVGQFPSCRAPGRWPDQSIQARLSGAICQPGGITSGLPVNRVYGRQRPSSMHPNCTQSELLSTFA